MIRWIRDRWLWLKWFSLVCSLLLCAIPSHGQGVVTGQETTISYTGSVLSLTPPNTAATQLSQGNTNTFLVPIPNPNVSVRVYITNNTVNLCSGFTVQMFSASDSQVTSFNNALANWQTVLLQNASGGLVPIVTLTIPASGAVYVSSTAIISPKLAIQVVNTAGSNCSTTSVEVTAVIAPVSLTSPLITTQSPSPQSGANQVQGIALAGYNSNVINPVTTGGASLPINGSFLIDGLDDFVTQNTNLTIGTATVTLGLTPATTQSTNELAVGIESATGSPGGTSINKPWIANAGCTSVGGGGMVSESFNPSIQNVPLQRTYLGSLGVPANLFTTIVNFKQGAVRQCNTGGGVNIGLPGANLAGSAIMVAVTCSAGLPCQINLGSSEGNTYTILSTQSSANGSANTSQIVWMTTNSVPSGSETVTFTTVSGTISGSMILEVSGPALSQINEPTTTIQTDTTGRQVITQDAQFPNQFNCAVTLSTNTTTQCQGITATISGVSVRPYVTDFQINTTTAGSATTLQLKTGTGTNCGTSTANLSAITYANTAVGLQNIIGFRTPLIGPLASEVCVTQAGTTAGTSVVEVHGFFAP